MLIMCLKNKIKICMRSMIILKCYFIKRGKRSFSNRGEGNEIQVSFKK
jgi:hypothetical protein